MSRLCCILSPCLFNFYVEYIMWNAGLDETQASIKIARRHINNLRYAGDTTLIAESEEELKSLLMRVKEGSEKACLKLNIKKLRSWLLVPSLHGKEMEEKWKHWQTIFLGSKITVDSDLQPWNQKTIASWQESYDKPRQCIEKQRHDSADKGPNRQGYSLPRSHMVLRAGP